MSTEIEEIIRIRANLAANRMWVSGLRVCLKLNPYWHLQPRVPAGHSDGGQWLSGVLGAAANLLPAVISAGTAAVRWLLRLGRATAPRLRSVPRKWQNEQPNEESYDKQTRRVSPYSRQIRFRSARELKQYLGPAGAGREWHHIVEQRLAGREGFPAELIHSTDNIISLPTEVHRRINARMGMRLSAYNRNIVRHELERRIFAQQYDEGITLILDALEEFGYDPANF